jgi:hypothetical protein
LAADQGRWLPARSLQELKARRGVVPNDVNASVGGATYGSVLTRQSACKHAAMNAAFASSGDVFPDMAAMAARFALAKAGPRTPGHRLQRKSWASAGPWMACSAVFLATAETEPPQKLLKSNSTTRSSCMVCAFGQSTTNRLLASSFLPGRYQSGAVQID